MDTVHRTSGAEQAFPSGYYGPSEAGHVELMSGAAPSAEAAFKLDQFASLIRNQSFPCVGAKSAFGRNAYRIGLNGTMASDRGTELLHRQLEAFTREQDPKTGTLKPPFTTFVAIFDGPFVGSEEETHSLVWEALQRLRDLDATMYAHSSDVAEDIADPKFGLSVCGRGFFVVGLGPCASRWSRRFAFPTLVFNAHFQFEWLKQHDMFEKLQTEIRKRDIRLQGSINPNLSDFGDMSEALQYSGLPTSEVRRCPFHFNA